MEPRKDFAGNGERFTKYGGDFCTALDGKLKPFWAADIK